MNPPLPVGARPLPAIYRSEQPGPLLASCIVCRGRVLTGGDVAACLMCGREVAVVLGARPRPYRPLGDIEQPTRGRPRGGVSGICDDCGGRVTAWARTGVCRPCHLLRAELPPKHEWPPCTVPGCRRVRKTYGGGICGRHIEEQRIARRVAS